MYLIKDNVHDEILAATLTERQAWEFCKNYLADFHYSPEEIAEEIDNMREDMENDNYLTIEEVPYTDGFYRRGEYDDKGNWIPPKYTED